MLSITQKLPGLLLVLLLALLAQFAAGLPLFSQLGLSALTIAIVGGMLLGNTLYPRLATHSHHGVTFAKGQILRLGIILFGFKLTFQDIAAVGMAGIVIDACVLTSTFALAYWLGRRKLGLDEQSVILIGAGSSICGAAAILATEPVVKAHAEKVAVAVATVVVVTDEKPRPPMVACGPSTAKPKANLPPKSFTTRKPYSRSQLKPTVYCGSIVAGVHSWRFRIPFLFSVARDHIWPPVIIHPLSVAACANNWRCRNT